MTKKNRVVFVVLLFVLALVSPMPYKASGQSAQEAAKAPRPIEMADSLAWKRIASPIVSNDGQWFACKLTPNEGDSELVLRRISDGKEWKFPVGESQGFGGGPAPAEPVSREVAFSEDSKWLAFIISPTFKEGKKLKKERKPLQNRVAVVNLATEKKVEFEKIKRFAFSGENAAWIALHKYGAESPTPPPAAPTAGASTPATDKPTGSDLILYELASGNQLNVGNVSDFAFDKKGAWLAWLVDANEKSGNGLQARNMTTSATLPLDSDKAVYKGLNWTEKGDGLATVKGVEDKGYEENLYSVVGFTGFASGAPQKTVYDPHKNGAEDKDFPAGMTISPNRNPTWTEDLSALLFGIHDVKKKKVDKSADKPKDGEAKPEAAPAKKPEDEPEKPDLVLWHWKDKRLQSQQQIEEGRDKNFSYLATYRVAEKKFIRLADEDLRNVSAAPKQQFAIGLDNRDYELMGNLDGRRYQDIYVVDLKTGAKKLAVKKNRWYAGPAPDGSHFLYYDDGHFFTYDMTSGRSYNITQKAASVFWNEEDDHNVIKPPTNVIGWTKDGASVLLSDNWDDYTSDKGDKLQGALHLPANYQPGKSYPTIVYIYEKLSQGANFYAQPTATGFNKSVYTSNGYAVLMPDIVYKVNDPGMSALWCVPPALEAAIKTGVVDKDRVAIHGHSWGGYQTAFLVTQTDVFKAAIAGAPLTDMISMYNLIYWNSGWGNMPIFESSQGRFAGSPLDVTEAYIRNSPIYHAKNVKTPLMILHNDKDGAMDFTQGIEYFSTLRRLQKPVVMLQYKGENHGLRIPANQKDYTMRMREFFDHHLMGKPAPKWLTDGVPHLKLKDHLDERNPDKTPPIAPLQDGVER